MIAGRMIPMIWVRLILLVGFAAFVGYQGMWIVTVIAVVLALLSGWQLAAAYREKERSQQD